MDVYFASEKLVAAPGEAAVDLAGPMVGVRKRTNDEDEGENRR